VHYTSLSQGRGEVKLGGCPGTPKGVQGLHPGIMLSRAHYGVPPLQLGNCGPPRRPHRVTAEVHGPPPRYNAVKGTLRRALSSAGSGAELEEASWVTQKFLKIQRVALVTPGDPRVAVAAKGSCLQAARGVTVRALPLCSDSLGGGATLFQDRPA